MKKQKTLTPAQARRLLLTPSVKAMDGFAMKPAIMRRNFPHLVKEGK